MGGLRYYRQAGEGRCLPSSGCSVGLGSGWPRRSPHALALSGVSRWEGSVFPSTLPSALVINIPSQGLPDENALPGIKTRTKAGAGGPGA